MTQITMSVWKHRGYFFDMDGTLLRAPEEDFYQTMGRLGFSYSLEEVYSAYYAAREWYRQSSFRLNSGEEIWRAFAGRIFQSLGLDERGSLGLDLTDLAGRLREEMDRREGDRLYPETRPVLQRLFSDGCALALISSRPGEGVRQKLASFQLTSFFTAVIAREDAPAIKPSPLPFRLALEMTGLTAEQCVYVGDMPEEDVEGAQGVGMQPYLVDRRGRYPEAPHVLRDLNELLRREKLE
ncbi:MAG: HAD family hydrolase [bacterium]|jgi:HAD superfamily hydrolase (TIGR01549 family)